MKQNDKQILVMTGQMKAKSKNYTIKAMITCMSYVVGKSTAKVLMFSKSFIALVLGESDWLFTLNL